MVRKFVDDNFDTEGTEFDDWIPQDWTENIPVYDHIKVSNLLRIKICFRFLLRCFNYFDN